MEKVSGESYFSREKKSKKEKGEEAFMKQGEKSEVRTKINGFGSDWNERLTSDTEETDTIRARIRSEVD